MNFIEFLHIAYWNIFDWAKLNKLTCLIYSKSCIYQILNVFCISINFFAIIKNWLMNQVVNKIYKSISKMESSSLTNSFNFSTKLLHIFEIWNLSIELIASIKNFFPVVLLKFTTLSNLFAEISLFSWQKKSSTGAISGVYCGKKNHEIFLFIR